jgi:hypothetical protein
MKFTRDTVFLFLAPRFFRCARIDKFLSRKEQKLMAASSSFFVVCEFISLQLHKMWTIVAVVLHFSLKGTNGSYLYSPS